MAINFRALSARIFILALFLLSIAIGLAPVALFWAHDYLVATAALVYVLPLYLACLIGISPLIRLLRITRNQGLDESQRRMTAWIERIRLNAPSDAEYSEARSRFWSSAVWLLSPLYGFFVLPAAILKAALGLWLGVRVAWWPDFQPVISVFFTWFSYFIASAGHAKLGLTISIYLFTIQLFEILTRFETRNGVLRVLSDAKHQIGPSTIAFAAAMMAAASGCIHYCISLLDPAAYSRPLSQIDGLYFSVTTFATVGYGDIYPQSTIAKLACIGEISTGCLVLIFSANLALTVWFQRFSEVKAAPPSTPSRPSDSSVEIK